MSPIAIRRQLRQPVAFAASPRFLWARLSNGRLIPQCGHASAREDISEPHSAHG